VNRNTIDDEKSSENLAKDDIRPTIGEVVQPEIIEEDFDDNSVQETEHAESIVNLGDQTHAERPSKSAEMLTDSVFMIFFKQNNGLWSWFSKIYRQ
jgi:hypothetical protein